MEDILIKITKLNISGNIIPQSWFKHIRYGKTNKPDLIAMYILSDIIYWYRLIEVRDEATGEVIKYKKKFKSDMLQKTYKSYAKMLGVPEKTIKRAINLLISLGLIVREFRTINTEEGLTLTNVMFLAPIPENIEKITFYANDEYIENDNVCDQKTNTYVSKKGRGVYTKKGYTPEQKRDIPTNKKGTDITENTTEITTEITTKYLLKEKEKNNIKKEKEKQNKFDKFISLLHDIFKQEKILTFKSKINKTKETKEVFNALGIENDEELYNLATLYAKYVKEHLNYAVRLNKWLIAFMEGNVDKLHKTNNGRRRAVDAVDEYFKWKESILGGEVANDDDVDTIDTEIF